MRKFQLTQCEINNLEINGDNAIIDVYKSIIHNANEPYITYFLDARKNIEKAINKRLKKNKSFKKQLQYAKSELMFLLDLKINS